MDNIGEFVPVIIIIAVSGLVGLITYVYYSYTLMVIAGKTGTEGGWMAWVPIANIILMLKIADKPLWWLAIMLLLPPLGTLICGILIWMTMAEKVGKPSWVAFLLLVPGVNFAIPAYLAFF